MPMRALVSFDGQNLYHLAMRAYGPGPPYSWPSYDVVKLAEALVSRVPGRTLAEVRFYTGVPGQTQDAFWNKFWNNKLRALQRQGVYVYRGRLNSSGLEKGVDVSLAIDSVEATHQQRYDVAIVVSQDSDLVLSQPPNNNYPNRLAEGRSKAIGPTLRFQALPIPRLTEY